MYIPKKGDIVKIQFDPQAGHEQQGWRPAIIVSNNKYNDKTGFVIACPISNTDNGFPLHIEVKDCKKTTGYVLTEQIKSLDYKARNVKYWDSSTVELLDEVLLYIQAYLFDEK